MWAITNLTAGGTIEQVGGQHSVSSAGYYATIRLSMWFKLVA